MRKFSVSLHLSEWTDRIHLQIFSFLFNLDVTNCRNIVLKTIKDLNLCAYRLENKPV